MQDCAAAGSSFRCVLFIGASLEMIDAHNADFSYADLSEVRAKEADFRSTSFVGANLAKAMLAGAELLVRIFPMPACIA